MLTKIDRMPANAWAGTQETWAARVDEGYMPPARPGVELLGAIL